jgi:hypothetical protein
MQILGVGLVTGVPVVVATVHAIQMSWTPVSDDGMIAIRSFDVLRGHPPLLGQYTQVSSFAGHPTFSLGPMLYWLLAIPAQIGPAALAVTTAAMNLACVVGAVAIAAWRGGRALMFVAAIAILVMCRSLPVEAGYEIFNPWAALFPFTLLLFVAWSVGAGEARLLPALALIGSFVVQCHLTYVLPVLAITVVAVVGLVAWPESRGRRLKQAGLARWVIASLIVALLCWSGPLVYELRHRPGNLELILEAATGDRPTTGLDAGEHVIAHTVGWFPWWAQAEPDRDERIVQLQTAPATVTTATAGLVLACLLIALALALRRREREAAVAVALSLVLCASVGAVAASVPTTIVGLSTVAWVLNWTSQVGAWAWVTLACSAWVLFGRAGADLHLRRRTVALGALGLTLLLSLAVATRSGDDPDRQPPGIKDFDLVRAATARTTTAVRGSNEVLIRPAQLSRTLGPLTLRSAIAYALRRKGVTVAFPAELAQQVGPAYYPHAGKYEHVVEITDGLTPARPGSRVVVRERPEVTVTLSGDSR